MNINHKLKKGGVIPQKKHAKHESDQHSLAPGQTKSSRMTCVARKTHSIAPLAQVEIYPVELLKFILAGWPCLPAEIAKQVFVERLDVDAWDEFKQTLTV